MRQEYFGWRDRSVECMGICDRKLQVRWSRLRLPVLRVLSVTGICEDSDEKSLECERVEQ